jgi:hypothetical protein
MKKHILMYKLLVPVCMLLMLSGCYKLQQDYNRTPHTIDPHTGLTAWQYMNSRNSLTLVDTIINGTTKTLDTVVLKNIDMINISIPTAMLTARTVTMGKPKFPAGATVSAVVKAIKVDTLFTQMLRMIRASGIDTSLYTQTDTKRTFILLQTNAIKRLNSTTKIYNDCFLGATLVNNSVGTMVSSKFVVNPWSAFPAGYLQNYLKWLILDGVYDHYTMKSPYNIEVNTLAPIGYFNPGPTTVTVPGSTATLLGTQSAGGQVIPALVTGANPNSTMKIRVLNSSPSNTSDYPIILNSVLNVTTSSILLTNGSAHVINAYFTMNIPTVDF